MHFLIFHIFFSFHRVAATEAAQWNVRWPAARESHHPIVDFLALYLLAAHPVMAISGLRMSIASLLWIIEIK